MSRVELFESIRRDARHQPMGIGALVRTYRGRGQRASWTNERTSLMNSSGCSKAAKWPPLSSYLAVVSGVMNGMTAQHSRPAIGMRAPTFSSQ
jgi:hypothetical protein